MQINQYDFKQSRLFEECRHCTPETGRSITCHSTCEKYLKAKAEWEHIKEEANEQRSLEYMWYTKTKVNYHLHKRARQTRNKRKRK